MAMMEYVLSPRGIIKLSQMVLVLITLSTWFAYDSNWRDFTTGTIFTAFFSALAIFTQNMIASHARVVEILMSGLLALFMAISGIIVLAKISAVPVGAACGSFCFFTAVAYGLDVFFAFRLEGTE